MNTKQLEKVSFVRHETQAYLSSKIEIASVVVTVVVVEQVRKVYTLFPLPLGRPPHFIARIPIKRPAPTESTYIIIPFFFSSFLK